MYNYRANMNDLNLCMLSVFVLHYMFCFLSVFFFSFFLVYMFNSCIFLIARVDVLTRRNRSRCCRRQTRRLRKSSRLRRYLR